MILMCYAGVMGCGVAEATGLGFFFCFFVINPFVLSANRVDFFFILFYKFSSFTPPPSLVAQQQHPTIAADGKGFFYEISLFLLSCLFL